MKYAVIGNGKTGTEISKILLEKNIHVSIFDSKNRPTIESLKECDLVFVFVPTSSWPEIANILIESKIDAIIGTTAIDFTKYNIQNSRWITGSNFSIIVNLFFKILSDIKEYSEIFDLSYMTHELLEQHHHSKQDAPSGTAKHALTIIDSSISSIRSPFDKRCIHEFKFSSEYEELKICHTTTNRSTYARGAIFAAKIIKSLPYGISSFEELIKQHTKDA